MTLLKKDVRNSSILTHVVAVQKYLRNVHMAFGLLKEKCGCVPQLPNETHWNSQVPTWRHTKRITICTWEMHEEKMPDFSPNIGKIIDNTGLFCEASHLLGQINIFVTAHDKMHSDSCHLPDTVHIWYSLMKDSQLSSSHEEIKKRFENAVQPIHGLAYMADHCFSKD
jgi:hypothetical protein